MTKNIVEGLKAFYKD